MLKIRCSQLGCIMTNGRGEGALSVGAKTYIEDLAKQHVYGYTKTVSTKEMQKGVIVESQSIDLLNAVTFNNYTKNAERFENDWIGGTPDIVSGQIIDIKSSWSLNTFPATRADAVNAAYEWQVRGYMMLTNRIYATVAHCLVDTPDELIGYEDESAHRVSHINPLLRITQVEYTRAAELEDKIKQKVEAAQEYFDYAVRLIETEHEIAA